MDYKEELISAYNGSGCKDLTAFYALQNIVKEQRMKHPKEETQRKKQQKNHKKTADKR